MPADVYDLNLGIQQCVEDQSNQLDVSQNTSVAAEQSEACRQIQDMTLLVRVVSTATTRT